MSYEYIPRLSQCRPMISKLSIPIRHFSVRGLAVLKIPCHFQSIGSLNFTISTVCSQSRSILNQDQEISCAYVQDTFVSGCRDTVDQFCKPWCRRSISSARLSSSLPEHSENDTSIGGCPPSKGSRAKELPEEIVPSGEANAWHSHI